MRCSEPLRRGASGWAALTSISAYSRLLSTSTDPYPQAAARGVHQPGYKRGNLSLFQPQFTVWGCQISGEAGTGKTNLCLQLCLQVNRWSGTWNIVVSTNAQVQLPQEQGGLDGIVPPAALHRCVCASRQRCVYYFGRCTNEAAAPDVSCISAGELPYTYSFVELCSIISAASCNLARQSYTDGLYLYGAR